MGKMTRTRRIRIAADMARILRELEQTSTNGAAGPSSSSIVLRPHMLAGAAHGAHRTSCSSSHSNRTSD